MRAFSGSATPKPDSIASS
uniref:Uncharacterized protein n=1 Tax=Anguilla anguilla TaxID=7936 RepID=A0A0E9UQP9_ANGAN